MHSVGIAGSVAREMEDVVTVGQQQAQTLQLAILSSHKQRGDSKVITTVLAGPFLQEHLHYLSGTLKSMFLFSTSKKTTKSHNPFSPTCSR